MTGAEPLTARSLSLRCGTAVLQGLTLWSLVRALDLKLWPATTPGLFAALVTVVVLVPLTAYVLAGTPSRSGRRWALRLMAAVLFGIGWHFGAGILGESVRRQDASNATFVFAFVLAVLWFQVMPFVQSALSTGRVRPAYHELFHYAWRNALLVALGAVFAGVLWLLLGLWATLFTMIGIRFFGDVFTNPLFDFPMTAVAFGIGLQLAGSVERLQLALREQLLTLLKWLGPLAALILALFSVALLVRSPALLAEDRRVIDATWLLWLVAVNVLLLNAAFQDGRIAAPYPARLALLIRCVVPLLVVAALMAIYALGVRVNHYGLTVSRVWGMLVALLATVYAVGYAWAAWRPGPWMSGIGYVNVGVAALSIALLVLMLTPALSPERLAATSQYRRILSDAENVTDDAYRTLRFWSGGYGRRRLADLASLQDHPRARQIRSAARTAQRASSPYYQEPPRPTSSDLALEAFPAGSTIDAALRDALVAGPAVAMVMRDCHADAICPVLFTDLDQDDQDEAIVFAYRGTAVLHRAKDPSRWTHFPGGGVSPPGQNIATIRQALRAGEYRLEAPKLRVLMVGDRPYVFELLMHEPGPVPPPPARRPP